MLAEVKYIPLTIPPPTKYRIISGRSVGLPDTFWHIWGPGMSIRRVGTWEEAINTVMIRISENSEKIGGDFRD